MNLEEKEGIVLPVGDEELENAAGGYGPSIKYVGYRCTVCSFRRPYGTKPSECPHCQSPMVLDEMASKFLERFN